MNQTEYPQGLYPQQPGPQTHPVPGQTPPAYGYVQPVPPPVYYAPVFLAKPPRDPRLTGATRAMNIMCLLVLLQTVASFVWTFLLDFLLLAAHVNLAGDPMAYLLLSGAMVPLSTALPFFVYLLLRHREASQFLRFEKVGFSTALLCVLAGLAVCLLGNFPAMAVQAIFGNFGYAPTPDPFDGVQSWPQLGLELFSTAVVVPVMEEFAFRGVLLSSLRKFGAGFALFGSALVFSLVHLDFANVVFAFVAGLVFGYLYLRTGNLWITICIHGLNNGIAVLGKYSGFLFGDAFAGLVENLMMFLPLGLGLIALIILIIRRREIFRIPGDWNAGCTDRPLKGEEAASCMVRSPLLWVVVSMMVFYTVILFF